jgi:hypothetical protein
VSELRRLAAPVTVLTGLLVIVVLFQPVRFGLAFRVWLVAVGALAAASLLRSALAPYRFAAVEPIRVRSRRAPRATRPPGLDEVERAVDFAGWNPADLRTRLRPLLREVVAARLEARAGVELGHSPAAARALLGETCWALVSDEFDAPDAGAPALREALGRLEAI